MTDCVYEWILNRLIHHRMYDYVYTVTYIRRVHSCMHDIESVYTHSHSHAFFDGRVLASHVFQMDAFLRRMH